MSGRRSRPMRWHRVLPALVAILVLGVLALHLMSHGRSLVTIDPDAAGHHPMASTSIATHDAHQRADLPGSRSPSGVACASVCDTPSMIMTCLLALVLLVGRLLLRAPPEVRWFALVTASDEVGQVWSLRRARHSVPNAVSPLWLGISRT